MHLGLQIETFKCQFQVPARFFLQTISANFVWSEHPQDPCWCPLNPFTPVPRSRKHFSWYFLILLEQIFSLLWWTEISHLGKDKRQSPLPISNSFYRHRPHNCAKPRQKITRSLALNAQWSMEYSWPHFKQWLWTWRAALGHFSLFFPHGSMAYTSRSVRPAVLCSQCITDFLAQVSNSV